MRADVDFFIKKTMSNLCGTPVRRPSAMRMVLDVLYGFAKDVRRGICGGGLVYGVAVPWAVVALSATSATVENFS